MRRREFLAGAAVVAGAARGSAADIERRICLFTDHLDDFLDVSEAARMLRDLGVGPDLTVRPGGFVKPERAAEDLPKAAAVFQQHGLAVPMISTALTSAADPAARGILGTAASLGIRYYKPGYYRYQDLARWRETLDAARRDVEGLARLGQQLGIRGGFHNHSGNLGGPLWDAWEILERLDPRWMGHYFDPTHAMIEGGKLGWKIAFQRSAPRIVMIGVKDFLWERTPQGWRTRWVPLGQGMVDWPEFFRMLRPVEFPGPVSLHIEYDVGGGAKNTRYDRCLEAAARDLEFLKKQIRAAYS